MSFKHTLPCSQTHGFQFRLRFMCRWLNSTSSISIGLTQESNMCVRCQMFWSQHDPNSLLYLLVLLFSSDAVRDSLQSPEFWFLAPVTCNQDTIQKHAQCPVHRSLPDLTPDPVCTYVPWSSRRIPLSPLSIDPAQDTYFSRPLRPLVLTICIHPSLHHLVDSLTTLFMTDAVVFLHLDVFFLFQQKTKTFFVN